MRVAHLKKDLKVAEDRGRTLVGGVRESANHFSKNSKLDRVVKNNNFSPLDIEQMQTTNQEAFIHKKLLNFKEEQWEFFMFWPH